MEDCKHYVGTCEREYQMDLVSGDDDNLSEWSNFDSFAYCPLCGVNVSDFVSEVEQRIKQRTHDFWMNYGKQHGDAELERASKGRYKLCSQ